MLKHELLIRKELMLYGFLEALRRKSTSICRFVNFNHSIYYSILKLIETMKTNLVDTYKMNTMHMYWGNCSIKNLTFRNK